MLGRNVGKNPHCGRALGNFPARLATAPPARETDTARWRSQRVLDLAPAGLHSPRKYPSVPRGGTDSPFSPLDWPAAVYIVAAAETPHGRFVGGPAETMTEVPAD